MLSIDTKQIDQLRPFLEVLSAAGDAASSANAAASAGASADEIFASVRPSLEVLIATIAAVERFDRSPVSTFTLDGRASALIKIADPFLPVLRQISSLVRQVASEVSPAQRSPSVQLAEHFEQAMDSFEDFMEGWVISSDHEVREALGSLVEQAKNLPKDFPHWRESLGIVPD